MRNQKTVVVGLGLVVALVALVACNRSALLGDRNKPLDYNWDVRPILSNNCFRCHGPDSKSRKAGLRLDKRDVATAELPESKGKFAIVPGAPDQSEIIRRISSSDPDVMMPPPSTHIHLEDEEIKTLTRWIEEGAQYKPHWAFIPPERQTPPDSKLAKPAANEIDAFIYERLEKEGLSPSPEADRETLIQRVTFSLTGLPATADEVRSFMKDQRPDAYERVVDRLLASDAYGERMASEWLDAARFADSDGYLDDSFGRLLYPWRDWVIKAFNSNMPYDQFGTWQLAGDLLPGASKEQRLATTFGRLHRRTSENGIIDEEYRAEYVIDRTDTLGTAFLGLSVGCARCHDHKFDPISHVDYYSLGAFFNSTDDAGFYPQTKWATGPTLMMTDDATDAKIADLRKRVAAEATRYAEELQGASQRVGAEASKLQQTSAVVASLKKSIASAQVAYYPFDGATSPPELVARYRKTDGLAPSEPLAFSPAATPGLRPAVLQAPIFKAGAHGKALFFDANNKGFLDKADKLGAFEGSDDFSLDFWIFPAKEYDEAAILNRTDHLRFGSGGWRLDLEKNRLVVQLINAYPKDQITVVTRDPLPIQKWTHLAITYDGSTSARGVRLYVNGKPVEVEIRRDGLTQSMVSLGIGFGAFDGFNGIAFGKRWQHAPLEGGGLDELRIFKRQLSSLEVAVLHDSSSLQGNDVTTQLTTHLALLDPAVLKEKETLRAARTELIGVLTSIPRMMVMGDTDAPRKSYVFERGVYSNVGETVFPRGLVQIFPYADSLPKNRLGLARWLFDPHHPLTARVYVNRLWQMHFGAGLVRTAEEFGSQGEAPTHPQLLDWLARRFVESKWDIKQLNKLIVMSETFRQSSVTSKEQLEKDPTDKWLGRAPERRLTAEMIRDNALAASGLLDRKVGGPSVFPYQPDGVWEALSEYQPVKYPKPETVPADQHRRSLYSLIRRGAPVPSMTIFDFPRRHTSQVRRGTSNTPLQALVLMNDPQYVEAARGIAERAMEEGNDTRARLAALFHRGARRAPSGEELKVLEAYFNGELAAFKARAGAADQYLAVGVDPVPAGVDRVTLAALASTASVVLNSPDAYLLR